MCGIAGIYNLECKPVDMDIIKKMIKVIKHRGPDDEGYYIDKNIGFGHCRLSIIDLSSGGHQPMSNEDESLWITYNGEIFNYLELMAELKNAGHNFKSRSDTEVVLHAYEEWGSDCVTRFNGMWAFAIWDKKKNKLFLSRDRFGIKPLYYYYDGKTFVFASEIKAFIGLARTSLNETYLKRFLAAGIMHDGEETFFRDIRSILPAHSLVLADKGLKMIKYWEFLEERVREKYDYKDAEGTFLSLLIDAVRLWLRADVKVGTCLSGGLDSSSIVSIISKKLGIRMDSFSSIYNIDGYDESRYVDLVARDCGTDSHKISPAPEELPEVLAKIVWYQDGPTPDPTLFSQWNVMREASKYVKVLLDGQGGDELLAGYLKYLPFYRQILMEKRQLIEAFVFCRKNNLEYIRPMVSSFLNLRKGNAINNLSDELLRDLGQLRLPGILHYEDRNSMAFSIEARTPLLDHRFVEFCLGLPVAQKINSGGTKVILRKTMRGILHPGIINRKDKMGYPTPAAVWFRQQLKDYVASILFSNSFKKRGYFDNEAVKRKYEEHQMGEKDHSSEMWRWITAEIFLRMFIDKKDKVTV